MMELNVNHIPYCVGLTKLIVRGTTCSEISILMHFKKMSQQYFSLQLHCVHHLFLKSFLNLNS